MADIKTIFGAINHLDTYQRVNSTHLLDLYVGNDDTARWTLLLISEYPPMKVASSRMILVKSGRRSDKKWSLSFSLVDDSYRDMFVLFCEDIISSSACIASISHTPLKKRRPLVLSWAKVAFLSKSVIILTDLPCYFVNELLSFRLERI